jgi:hypothetical protein
MIKAYHTRRSHLEIKYTPEEYAQLLDKAHKEYGFSSDDVLGSRSLISRCPFCGAAHTAFVDCHSIYNLWATSANIRNHGISFGNSKTEEVGCKHFNRVQRFLNIEGTVPVEIVALNIDTHIPFIMPFYLPEDVPSAAVIHSFPICRIEAVNGFVYNLSLNRFVEPIAEIKLNRERKWIPFDSRPFADISDQDREQLKTSRFVPRYTGFAVTYYARDPEPLIKKYVASQWTDDLLTDHDFTIADLRVMADMEEMARFYPEGYNLAAWVKKGKLLWLDLESLDLPLKAGPDGDFPYDTDFFDVTGTLERFEYQMGLFEWRSLPR